MKKQSILLLFLLLSFDLLAQSVVLKQPFQELPNTTVLDTYGEQFRKWIKPDLDDTFPYVVMRVGLEGSTRDINMAKQMLGLYMGTQTAVEAIDRSRDDELLFLIPKRARHIEISCGDGCARLTIMDGTKSLKSNTIYYGRIHYIPLQEGAMMTNVRQKFQVQVTPNNALVEVFIDGRRELWPVINGVASKMLNQGSYRYRVSANNYYPEEGSFVVTPHTSELQVSLRPQFGWVTVGGDTQLYGAYVFATDLNTNNTIQLGTIPIERGELPTGRYALTIQLDKYKDYSTTVTIREAENTNVRPIMEPNYSMVTLTAAPQADIYIDGNRMGKGVWTGTLEYGNYMIETRQQSHTPAYTPIAISTGDANVAYELNNPTPMYGTLIIDGEPLDAAIWIDNVYSGTTPMVFNQILVGEHRVRLSRDGFLQQEVVVAIEEGQDKTMAYSLYNTREMTGDNIPKLRTSKGTHVFTVKDVDFAMVEVPGGSFIMGATAEQAGDAKDNEIPIHQVSVSNFYIGQTEVTQALWQAVMGTNPSSFPSNMANPVENVSWNDCQAFLRKLNQLTGQDFRFPTEAEWEYAARGGHDTIAYKYAGDSIAANVAWSVENSDGSTHIVAAKQPNRLGIYDMSGNVCEWCSDWYGNYQMLKQTDPQGLPSGSYKVYRGGSWYFDASYARVSQRNYHTTTFSNYNIGLRLAMTKIVDEQSSDNELATNQIVVPAIADSTTMIQYENHTLGMVLVPGGEFLMGATEEQGNDAMGGEKPIRTITLSDFRITQTEVTQALWMAIMGDNPSKDTTHLINPVTNVSWQDCQTFITKLNSLTGRTFRLPTEAEWEYAARGGQSTKKHKYAGSATLNQVAWHNGNSNGNIHPIGQKQPNEIGLYDMSGNVSEWCHDWFGTYDGNQLTDPQGPASGSYKVVRGGSALTPMRSNRVSYRNGYAVDDQHPDVGFRLVEEVEMTANQPVEKYVIPKDKNILYFEVKGVPFSLVKVESGTFIMGAAADSEVAYDWEKPMHYVTVSDYFIGQSEVTQELWRAVMDSIPSRFQNNLANPVENVTWDECQQFITKLNALTGADFRLPTEAEWEFAARGGKQSANKTYPGSDNVEDVAWYRDNSMSTTHPVGLKSPNELGIYDMGGNVWEWCADWYGKYESTSQINPTGPTESSTNRRVIRGGSWAYSVNNCRVTVRNGQVANSRKVDIGFRLAL